MDIREKLKPPLDKSRAATEGMTALIAVVGRGRWFVIKKHCSNGHDNQDDNAPADTFDGATNNLNCFHLLFSFQIIQLVDRTIFVFLYPKENRLNCQESAD